MLVRKAKSSNFPFLYFLGAAILGLASVIACVKIS
jgi:hypothetical protein